MFFSRNKLKHIALQATAAAVAAAAITLSTLHFLPEPELVPPPPLLHNIPTELVCLSAATPAEPMPETIISNAPHLRIREYAPGQYELLYWGNPVRPRYVFSITNMSDGTSALLQENGQAQRYRDLIVSVPPQADKSLPLQPVTKLHRLRGKYGQYYAARICIHDAANGQILCSAIYLLCGNSEN